MSSIHMWDLGGKKGHDSKTGILGIWKGKRR
jgi:hypothetical protein